MSIKETVKNSVFGLAEIGEYNVLINNTQTMYAFMTEIGLCLVGIHQIGGESEYFDLRCRFLLGIINEKFNPIQSLKINYDTNDAKYGLAIIDRIPILTATDEYRFLTSWGDNNIKNYTKSRFGGYLLPPFFLKMEGCKTLDFKFYKKALQDVGIDKLLGIKKIVNYNLIDSTI
jgi:hypothetical protein